MKGLQVTVPIEFTSVCVTTCHVCNARLDDTHKWEPFAEVQADGETLHVAVCFPCLDIAYAAWLNDTREYLDESFEHMSSVDFDTVPA